MGTEGEYGWDGWLGTYFCNSPAEGLTLLATYQRKSPEIPMTPPIGRLKNVVWSSLSDML